jgi:prefoldin beta subunit
MNQEEMQKTLMEFERNRGQLVNVSNQKQQVQLNVNVLGKALEELDKTSEKKVYQAVGNIMILKETKTVKKEMKEQKESLELRVKTLQKQEDALIDKLNSLKTEIEGAQQALTGEPTAAKPKEEKSEKEKK